MDKDYLVKKRVEVLMSKTEKLDKELQRLLNEKLYLELGLKANTVGELVHAMNVDDEIGNVQADLNDIYQEMRFMRVMGEMGFDVVIEMCAPVAEDGMKIYNWRGKDKNGK